MLSDQSLLALPAIEDRKEHIIQAMDTYWRKGAEYIRALPIKSTNNDIQIPLRLKEVHLPEWASHCGVNGLLLVPVEACIDGSDDWNKVDWWTASFLYLEAWHERIYEQMHGPIHSYSFRLKNWDQRAWDHAWVNRIAMFLRKWASHFSGQQEAFLFGKMNPADIMMTHDVDAVSKTNAIRLKQAGFNVFNAIRSAIQMQWQEVPVRLKQAWTFLFSRSDWWKLPETLEIEQNAGISSQFNFYADSRKKTIKRWLFDPGYDLRDKKVLNFMQEAISKQFVIGLHPAYDSWYDRNLIQQQRESLSKQTNYPVQNCRQHWLRFEWSSTWGAQEKAGLKNDTTVMFNDRPGFRVSAVLQYRPWNQRENKTFEIHSLPTVIMDSHLYDYQSLNDRERELEMERWVEEIRLVNGKAAVLWHPHTLSKDYGWRNGFVYLVNLIKYIKYGN
jgi:hypothetical protein